MADIKFDYPSVLKKSDWDKNKGVMAKLAVGKTDVGAALKDIEDEFKAAGFAVVKDPASLDPVDFQAHETTTSTNFKAAAEKIRNKVGAAEVIATAAQADFNKSKVVSDSSKAYVKKVLDGLKAFKATVVAFPELVKTTQEKTYQAALKASAFRLTVADNASKIDEVLSAMPGLVSSVTNSPTFSKLHEVFDKDGPARRVATFCQMWDTVVKKNFPKTAAKHYAGTAMTDILKLPSVQIMGDTGRTDRQQEWNKMVQEKQKTEKEIIEELLKGYISSWSQVRTFLTKFKAVEADLKAAES